MILNECNLNLFIILNFLRLILLWIHNLLYPVIELKKVNKSSLINNTKKSGGQNDDESNTGS